MTTEVEHPLVDVFEENGIAVMDYLGEEADDCGLIEFDGEQSAADRGMELVRNSDVKLRALRYVRYFGDSKGDETAWEILFRKR